MKKHSDKGLTKLDRNLFVRTGNRDRLYGGVNVIFVGDFRQIYPTGGSPVYQTYSVHCHSAINNVIFLNKSYRFKDDPYWGRILERVSKGGETKED